MKTKQDLTIGAPLSNGGTLLAWKVQRESIVVLALYHNEYVTWLMDADGGCFEGHYHRDLLEAVEEFKQRT
jgi:hypothetical protein